MPSDNIPSMSPFEYFEYIRQTMFKGADSQLAVDACDVLAANLLGALPDNQRAMLERIHVGVLPTRQPNAMVIQVPAGGEVIAIDYGMMSLLVALNKVLLCRLNSLGFHPTLELEDAAGKAASAVRSLHDNRSCFPRWPVSPRRMLLASILANVQIAFIVAHELGHVLLGHLRHRQHNEELGLEQVVSPRELESVADQRACELVLASSAKTHDPLLGGMDRVLAEAGIDVLFTYLEFVRDVLKLPKETPTHPSPDERKAALRRQSWGAMPEQAKALAVEGETLFRGFPSATRGDPT